MDPTQDPSFAVPNTPNFINPAYATPSQRAQLYQYANALMQPQPIKSGWQGLASIANALVGGYMGHQADVQEQASRANSQRELTPSGGQTTAATASVPAPSIAGADSSGVLMPPAAPSDTATSGKVPDPADYPTTQAGQTAFLRDYAPFAGGRGMDPNFALGVGGAEGLGAISPQNPSGASSIDIDPKTGKPFSFGALQLNVRNGLGAEARAAGIDPADPTQANKANKFALDYMATRGLDPWKGDKAVEAYRATLASAPPATGQPPPAPATGGLGYAPGVPPAVAAMGAALAPRVGAATQRIAQGGGPTPAYSAGQLAAIIADPNLPPEIRAHAFELTQPKSMQDVLGNVSPVYQGQSVGAPIFHGGAPGPNIGGVAPSILSGTPTTPTSTLAIPQVAGSSPIGRGGLAGAPPVLPATGGPTPPPAPPPNVGAAIFAPGTPVGDIIAAKQASDARGAATTNVAGGSADQYVRDMQGAINYQRSALPLQKAIPALEKLGTTGTGPGTETWNEVMSFLQSSGMPGIDTSKIKDFDEAKKYLTDYVNQNGDHGTNDRLAASFAGNPSVGISNAAAVDVAKTAAAMQRYKQAQVMSFGGAMDPTTGQPMSKDKYLDYAANFQSKYDPRAFGIDMMGPPAIAALDKEMPVGSETRDKFNRSLKMAKDLGLVTR